MLLDIDTYQWVKGDHVGTVETIKDSDNEWISFQSGRRIAIGLINEYMIPIQNEKEKLNFNETVKVEKPAQVVIPKTLPEKKKKSHLYDIIENIKVKEQYSSTFNINYNLPKKDMINILISSYDEEEVLNALKQYVLDQIDANNIQKDIDKKFSDINSFL